MQRTSAEVTCKEENEKKRKGGVGGSITNECSTTARNYHDKTKHTPTKKEKKKKGEKTPSATHVPFAVEEKERGER